jgi:gallate dioxygenase
MWPHEHGWPGAIVPLQVGVLEFPIPTARRCFRLGKSLRRAIESYPEELRVAIVATGGLAHQVHGERAGFNNTPWDKEFLDLLEREPERLAELTIAQYAERGGLEGAEVIMWLIMRGALSAKVRKLHNTYYLPSMTPIVTVIYEDETPVAPKESDAEYRERIARELAGVERLPGTYPFTLDRSVKAYRLNSFLHRLIEPEFRRRFLADAEPLFAEASLTAEERDLVRRRDWRALIHYGVIFFLLEKLAAVLGITNLHVYAAMRGETLEEFQKTRNVQMLYSVAGQGPQLKQ